MTHVIELNDAGVLLASERGIIDESPGYALLDGKQLVVGREALARARLDPRHTQSQFWQRLSQEALQHPNPRARTHADLAHAHLLALWGGAAAGDDEVIFAIPASFRRDQLALLLGIARACPFRAVGLVDAALAAAAGRDALDPPALHLDAGLHQTVVTRLARDDETLTVEGSEDVTALGLVPVRDAWVNLIADHFIRETRFDPLHHARTEQQLYDRLERWIDALGERREVVAEVASGDHVYRVELDRDAMVAKVAPRYATLIERLRSLAAGTAEAPVTVLVAHRLARLPGLLEALRAEPGLAPMILPHDAAVRGALAYEDRIRSDDAEGLAFVRRLPAPPRSSGTAQHIPAPGPPPAATRPAVPAVVVPTHALLGARAWPLRAEGLALGGSSGPRDADLERTAAMLERSAGGWRLVPEPGESVRVQGRTAETPFELEPGVTVELGEAAVRLELIRVEGGEPPGP